MPTKSSKKNLKRKVRRTKRTCKEVKPLKGEWKKIQEESRGAEREKAEEGRGEKSQTVSKLALVASTVSCQMMIFQM